MEWIDAFDADQVPAGGVRVLRRGAGGDIAVFRRASGELLAVDNRCPHEGYPLSQGTLCGDALTCCYHNFKFDVRTGACSKGEAVAVHGVRERSGRVEVRMSEPDPSAQLEARWRSWEEAMFEEREGQALRDMVRLIQLGVPVEELAVRIAIWDAERGPWGCTHGAVTAAEVLAFAEDGPHAVRALAVAMQQTMRAHVRRPRQPEVAAEPGATPADVADRVEREDADGAEAALRGLLAEGHGRAVLEPLFWELCAAHFLDFGHPAIYTAGLFDFLDRVGWTHAERVLVGLLRNAVHATREDLLPGWSRFRSFLSSRADAVDPDAPGLEGLAELSVSDALRAVHRAQCEGRSVDAVCDALVDAAADRMLRFDTAIDESSEVQDGWLSVTHCLTFAHATRRGAAAGYGDLLLQAARMVAHHRVLDGPAPHWTPRSGSLDDLEAAIVAGDEQAALDLGAWAFSRDRNALLALLRRLCLSDRAVRGIVTVHLVKTVEAAFREGRLRPVLAAVRLLTAPVRERWTQRRAHEAIRFVVEGKTPRLLAP